MFKLGVVGAAVAIAASLAGSVQAAPQDNAFTVTNLVTDSGASAATVDPSLVNGWGLSAGPTTPWWVSSNGTNTSTLYNGAGAKQALTVAVPGAPTGTVFSGSATDFPVTENGKTGAARFLVATARGTTTSPAAGSAMSTRSPPTGSSGLASRPAAGRTRRRTLPGAWRSLPRASGRSPATCWSGTSATAGSAPTRTTAAASGSTRES